MTSTDFRGLLIQRPEPLPGLLHEEEFLQYIQVLWASIFLVCAQEVK